MNIRLIGIKVVLMAILLTPKPNALAASCDHPINAIGSSTFVIDMPGEWCLENDVHYSGNDTAIRVNANNVTLSLNDYRVTGPDSPHTHARGIESVGFSNLSIIGNDADDDKGYPGNTITGFLHGISLIGGSNVVVENIRLSDNYQHGVCARDISGTSIRDNIVERTGGHGFLATEIRGDHSVYCSSSPAVSAIVASRGSSVHVSNNVVKTTTRNRNNNFYAYGITVNSRNAVVENNEVANSQNIGILTNLGYQPNDPGLGVQLTGNKIWNNGDFRTFCQFHPTSAANDLHNGIRMSGYLDFYDDNVVKGFYQPFWNGSDGGNNRDNGEGNDGGLIRHCTDLESR